MDEVENGVLDLAERGSSPPARAPAGRDCGRAHAIHCESHGLFSRGVCGTANGSGILRETQAPRERQTHDRLRQRPWAQRAGYGRLDVEVDLDQPRSADLAALMPGVTRAGRTVAFTADTTTAAYGTLQLIVLLAQITP